MPNPTQQLQASRTIYLLLAEPWHSTEPEPVANEPLLSFLVERVAVELTRLLDIPELLSAYMRYVKAKHESIDSKLLPGYKGHVIARLLDIPELVSAYMRYVKAKHKRNVTGLLPGYKGHVIARLLDIPELLSAYKRRYEIAKLCVCESMMLDKRDEKLTLMNTIDMKTLKQITKGFDED
ncbi:hypothetical protein E3N88_14543 [Mikania micrantha]|uniref:Uncharacterized protein n=1 Tax=Mikania micrantha TaxID=192012 RepID=A0A5N6P3P6_9ASTR|nr:hypothetical protein E3N88_14543 [Mikania micrantha]